MNSISGSSSYSASSAKTKGFSGLASGMDTESMVEKMLSGTQAKIDKQNAAKQTLAWKQAMYRDAISSIRGFKENFFSFAGKNNILSSGFYNSMSAVTKSSAIKVSAGSNAATGDFTIDKITQLASNTKIQSANEAAAPLTATVDLAKLAAIEGEATIDIKLDGVSKTITLNKRADSVSYLADEIQKEIDKVHGSGIKVEVDGDKILFKGTKADGTLDKSRNITIGMNSASGAQPLLALGVKNGASNKVNVHSSLKDAGFAVPLQGSSFKFSINGVEIEASATDSISDLIGRIESSAANVKVTYNSIENKFSMESKETGSGRKITMNQERGNVLSSMFGVYSGVSVGGYGMVDKTKFEANGKADDTFKTDGGNKLIFTLNGKEQSIVLPKKGEGEANYTTISEIVTALNEELDKKDDTKGISLSLNNDGKVVVHKPEDANISFQLNSALSGLNQALGFAIGQSTQTKVTEDTELSALGLGGKIKVSGFNNDGNVGQQIEINVDDYTTLGDFRTALNNKLNEANGTNYQDLAVFDEKTGAIDIQGLWGRVKVEGMDAEGKTSMSKLYGNEYIETRTPEVRTQTIREGTNAVIVVDGHEMERSSNTFDFDGLTIDLVETSDEPIKITTTRDTDKVVAGMEEFVKGYNEMISKLTTMVKEDPTYKKYPPLTAEQKKEMSEGEVKLWEENAKKGLLRSDSAIGSLLSDMRSVLFMKPEGAKYSLYDLGIDSEDYFTKKDGEIKMEDGNEKLKLALSTDPTEIERLFTQATDGLAVKMSEIMDQAIKISSTTPGSLISIAGASGLPDTTSSIYKQTQNIDSTLESLKRNYELEKNRYWKQFNSMEQMVQNMNQQSAWLASQFMQQ